MREMEACWPSGVDPAGVGVKPPCAALAEDRRGERQGEGALDRVRWGSGRRSRIVRSGRVLGAGVVVEASKPVEMTSKPRSGSVLGMSLAAARVAGQVVSGVEAA